MGVGLVYISFYIKGPVPFHTKGDDPVHPRFLDGVQSETSIKNKIQKAKATSRVEALLSLWRHILPPIL